MPIRPFIGARAFDPETIVAMSEALAAALKVLNGGGPPKILIEVIAERIIVAATNGEREPARLLEAALAGLPGEED